METWRHVFATFPETIGPSRARSYPTRPKRPYNRRMNPKPKTTYTVASVQTWELVRTAYLSGHSAPAAAARFGVSVSALRKRARREGWTKAAYASAVQGPVAIQGLSPTAAAEPDAPTPFGRLQSVMPTLRLDPTALARRALERAAAALEAGRPAEAAAHARAADAIARLDQVILPLDGQETPEVAQWRYTTLQDAIFEQARDLADRMARGEAVPGNYAEAAARWGRNHDGRCG